MTVFLAVILVAAVWCIEKEESRYITFLFGVTFNLCLHSTFSILNLRKVFSKGYTNYIILNDECSKSVSSNVCVRELYAWAVKTVLCFLYIIVLWSSSLLLLCLLILDLQLHVRSLYLHEKLFPFPLLKIKIKNNLSKIKSWISNLFV